MTDTTDDYGYLLVHFIEDPDGYAEKIYMDISDGDNPHRWVPLNDGKPVLASHLGTTGVRDPHIIRNPDTGTWYIIATDLRVFGGDGGGWYEWSHHASTNLIIWESDDLLHWSEPRMLDVSRKPGGSHLELGMAWACECLWVPDYYPQGHHGGRGAFVMYWSSTVFDDEDRTHDDKNVYCTVLWGATTDFTQDTFEYGGVFIDNHGDAIDTTMIQRPLPDGSVRTYRITKDNAHGTGIWMDRTDAKRWWEPGTVWTKVQDRIGAGYVPDQPRRRGRSCGVRQPPQQRWTGRRMVLVRGRDSVDRIPSDGQPRSRSGLGSVAGGRLLPHRAYETWWRRLADTRRIRPSRPACACILTNDVDDRAPACARGKTKGASRNNREAPFACSLTATAIAVSDCYCCDVSPLAPLLPELSPLVPPPLPPLVSLPSPLAGIPPLLPPSPPP